MSKAVFRKPLVRLVVSALSLGFACGVTSARSEAASLARAAPSALPALGDPSSESLSPSTERKLGESIMRDIRRSQAGDEDLDVIAYLDTLGRRLIDASKSGQDFEFFLVRDSSLNAFALPGGFIGVHAGLIAAAESESELAGVLAHEIGHVTQRHIARMLGKSRDAGIAQMVGLVLAALAARSNPQATPGLIALGQQMAQDQMLSFSRDAEREADRIGFDTLTRAGFDPQGMVSFFGRIQRASRVYESAAPAYLRTHPLTTERMSDMQARIRQERYKQWPDSLGFRLIRARMQALLDPSVDGLRRSAERFEFQIKEQSTLDLAAAWFGLASVREAQLRWHDAFQAAQLARDLLQHEGLNNDSAASAIEPARRFRSWKYSLGPSSPSSWTCRRTTHGQDAASPSIARHESSTSRAFSHQSATGFRTPSIAHSRAQLTSPSPRSISEPTGSVASIHAVSAARTSAAVGGSACGQNATSCSGVGSSSGQEPDGTGAWSPGCSWSMVLRYTGMAAIHP